MAAGDANSSGRAGTRKGVPPGGAASAATFDLEPGYPVGEYEIEQKLGEGSMGAVYAAAHPIIGKRVAIKVIGHEMCGDADAVARFRREARAVAKIASPHIVDVFGFGELPDGRSYYVMELLTGESLRERLARGRMPLDEALALLVQIVRGLHAAHDAGIVHRDLKPENIFIDRSQPDAPMVKLLDFGLVKLVAQKEDTVTATQAGVMFGTPLYISPEQIKSAANVDHRTDLYALGCIAYEMIAGRRPFDGVASIELIVAHLEHRPPPPRSIWSEIPASLDALLLALVAKDPAKRPTLGHVEDVIERVREQGMARRTAVATGDLAPRRPRPKMSRRAIGVAVLAGLVLLFVGVVATRTSDDAPRSASGADRDAGAPRPTLTVEPLAEVTPIPPPETRPAPDSPTSVPAPEQVPRPRPEDVVVRQEPVTSGAAGSATPSLRSQPTTGELSVSAKPPCEVIVDGRPTGRYTPLVGLALAPGMHRVLLRNRQFEIEETMTVQIVPGKHVRIVKNYTDRMQRIDPNGTVNPFKGARR